MSQPCPCLLNAHTFPNPTPCVLSLTPHPGTGQTQYASDAAFYMRQHLQTEARPKDPTYYIPNYDNMVWPAHVLMAGEMGAESSRAAAAQFVRAWMTGKVRKGA